MSRGRVTISDLAKDCIDALQAARAMVDTLVEEQQRCLRLMPVPVDPAAKPALYRYGASNPDQHHACAWCGVPAPVAVTQTLPFIPAYFAACCGGCAAVLYPCSYTSTRSS